MKKELIAVVACMPLIAWASGEDLERCLYRDGAAMDQRVCNVLRKKAEQDAEVARRSAQQEQAYRERMEQWQAQQAEQDQAQRVEQEKRAQAWKHEVAKRDEEYARERKKDELAAKAEENRQAQLRQECGSDYRKPSIGMTIDRARQCVGSFKLVGQVNRADGVVSTFVSGRTFLHVMDGRIVSWGK